MTDKTPNNPQYVEQLEKACRELIDCVNATGGAKKDEHGNIVPLADEDWIDLGSAYERASNALGVEMMLEDEEDG